jgi:hypothetical protein
MAAEFAKTTSEKLGLIRPLTTVLPVTSLAPDTEGDSLVVFSSEVYKPLVGLQA